MQAKKVFSVVLSSMHIQTELQEQLADQTYTLEKEREKQKENIRRVCETGIQTQQTTVM